MTSKVRAWLGRLLGERGEREAARFLRRRGIRVLTRNYRTAQGEVDLVARDGPTLVFVEVKSRRHGDPAEAVTPEKQRRITRAALHFMKRYGVLEVPCRFDVVTVVWPEGRRRPSVEHYPHAFESPERDRMF